MCHKLVKLLFHFYSIYNSVHHTCEYNQLQNRSNHFDTPGIYLYLFHLMSRDLGPNGFMSLAVTCLDVCSLRARSAEILARIVEFSSTLRVGNEHYGRENSTGNFRGSIGNEGWLTASHEFPDGG